MEIRLSIMSNLSEEICYTSEVTPSVGSSDFFGLVQNGGSSIADALELLQSCAWPYWWYLRAALVWLWSCIWSVCSSSAHRRQPVGFSFPICRFLQQLGLPQPGTGFSTAGGERNLSLSKLKFDNIRASAHEKCLHFDWHETEEMGVIF